MSLSRKGLNLLFVAFVLRVLNHFLRSEFAAPYEGRTGLPELVTSSFETALPIALDVLALGAIVAGAILLVAPALQRQFGLPSSTEVDRLDV